MRNQSVARTWAQGWVLYVAALSAWGGAGPAWGDGAATARAVIEGCRVREDTTCGFEFTAITERFVGRRTLANVLVDDSDDGGPIGTERADEILTLTTLGDAEGSRAKFVERHRVTADEWEVEARCTVWGGADRYFLSDVGRPFDDVTDLYMKKLYRPDFEVAYSTGPIYKCAMVEVVQPRGEWSNAGAPCADYVGLNLAALGRLSEVVGRWVEMASSVTAERTAYDGREAVDLTIRVHAREGVWSTYRLGFVELDGYAPVRAELSSVVSREDGTEGLLVTVCTWGDYAQLPEGPWIPCIHRLAEYSSDPDGVLRLCRGANVSIDGESVRLAEGRVSDAALTEWCPIGTLVRADPGVEDRLPNGVVAAWSRHQGELWPEGAWYARRIETLVLGMGDPLFTAPDAQRKELAAAALDQVKRDAEARQ